MSLYRGQGDPEIEANMKRMAEEKKVTYQCV